MATITITHTCGHQANHEVDEHVSIHWGPDLYLEAELTARHCPSCLESLSAEKELLERTNEVLRLEAELARARGAQKEASRKIARMRETADRLERREDTGRAVV
jgi:hypothetical protein